MSEACFYQLCVRVHVCLCEYERMHLLHINNYCTWCIHIHRHIFINAYVHELLWIHTVTGTILEASFEVFFRVSTATRT